MLLSNGRIGLVQTGAGYALVAEGDVSLVGISGVTISGHASVRVNTTGQTIDADALDPGQHRRSDRAELHDDDVVKSFGVIGAQIAILGQTLSGNVAFESTAGGDVAVAATNVTLALTGVSLSNASGALLLTPAGLAGQLRGTLAVTIPGVCFSGSFSVGVNTTAAPVSKTFDVGGDEVVLNVPAGPYLRVEGTRGDAERCSASSSAATSRSSGDGTTTDDRRAQRHLLARRRLERRHADRRHRRVRRHGRRPRRAGVGPRRADAAGRHLRQRQLLARREQHERRRRPDVHRRRRARCT